MNEGMVERLARTSVVKRRPILLGYVAAIVTIELMLKLAQVLGWVR